MEYKKNQNEYMKEPVKTESNPKKRGISNWWIFSGLTAIILSSLVNYLLYTSNSKLKKEVIFYKNIEKNNTEQISNLKRLNEGGINLLEKKIGELKQNMPIRGLFESLERLVGGIGLFNENPLSTNQIESIEKESQSYPENFNELWSEWKIKTHGLQNYAPKISWLLPPRIGDGENTVVQQDFGKNVYIMILGEGYHNGIDLTNKFDRRLYSNFNGKIIEDRDSPEKGRTVTIQADNKDEQGYMYRMKLFHLEYNPKRFKPGQKIKENSYLGNYGSTGFVNGAHLHTEFSRSLNGKNWETFDAFENKTYKEGENIVWFNFWNVPDSIKERIKDKFNLKE